MTPPLDRATLHAMSTECVCFNLRRTTRAITQLYDQILDGTGLRSTQVSLLVAFAEAGPVPSARVAEAVGMDPTTLSRNLQPLRRAGLITVTAGTPDRRVKLVTLTAKGRKVLTEVAPKWDEAQRKVVEALGRDRWNPLRAELARLTHIAGAGT